MRVLFRVDSSLNLGSGHVMRCLNLAACLVARGAEVFFACREYEGNMNFYIQNRGFAVYPLPAAPCDWSSDVAQTRASIGDEIFDWLILDHYSLDVRWESAMRFNARKLMVIDDLADRNHECDVLLDQNFYCEPRARYRSLVSEHCHLLLGPRYAILGEQFSRADVFERKQISKVGQILVFFGGSDLTNETIKALRALVLLERTDISIDVVLGALNPHQEEVQKFAKAMPNTRCYVQTENIRDLMLKEDLALGAGGTTAWERCAVGLPCITLAVAENQVACSSALNKVGGTVYLGPAAAVTSEALSVVVQKLLESPAQLQLISEIGRSLVDARGALRVGRCLLPPRVHLRRAVNSDCDTMHVWRNAAETREQAFNSEPITLEAHRQWFARTIQSPSHILLVGEKDGRPIGVLRYDLSADAATVSIYVVPGLSGHGFGPALLRAGHTWLRENHSEVRCVLAKIKVSNTISKLAFLDAGFYECGEVFESRL